MGVMGITGVVGIMGIVAAGRLPEEDREA